MKSALHNLDFWRWLVDYGISDAEGLYLPFSHVILAGQEPYEREAFGEFLVEIMAGCSHASGGSRASVT